MRSTIFFMKDGRFAGNIMNMQARSPVTFKVCIGTVSAKKNAHFFKLVPELCQFLGGS